MPTSRCQYCNHKIVPPVCSFCGADYRIPIPKAILPANKSGCSDVKLKYPPRKMFALHTEGVTIERGKYSLPHIGKPWTWDLIAVPMETVRRTLGFKKVKSVRARENLQIWVDNLGPALYNPITWRLQQFYELRRVSPSAHLTKKGLYIRQYDGSHRIRALEALDFNFVYLLFALGFPTISKEQRAKIAMLFRPAIRYHTALIRKCGKCKKSIKWVVSKDKRIWSYKCPNCGYALVYPAVYPEPV